MKKYNVAVIGAGVVGIEMLRVLKQRKFPINNLKVFARSARDINVDWREACESNSRSEYSFVQRSI